MQAGSQDRVSRRLAAILAADVVGYSRLMEADEAGTARALREHRAATDPIVAEHGGRIVKTTGDGVLIEFPSVVGAVQCAVAFQKRMAERNSEVPSERRMEWRIGIHLGDILIEGEDILGDGVNLAARLEGIAEPGGICISEDSFRQVQGKIETEFLDGGERVLKNIARPVRIYRARATSTPVPSAPPATNLPLPNKPSIAVLPFQNMSGDPEQEYFVDGMVEEIITALSRIRWLFVIARNSSHTYKGQVIDVKRVGRELGVRYILEGSVRKAGNRVRITGQLIDADTGAHLWADRFDGPLDDVFQLQDEVAASVAGVIEPALRAAEIRRSAVRPTRDSTAYDLYLRALPLKDRIPRALDLFERAIGRDPNYGPALALSAHCHHQLMDTGAPETHRAQALALARRALQAAPEDPEVLAVSAFVLGLYGDDLDVAISMVDRALALNPSSALGWYWSGLLRVFAGSPDTALKHFETLLRLSPRERHPIYQTGIGIALFMLGCFEEAVGSFLQSLERVPDYSVSLRFLAAAYAHLGRIDEARAAFNRLRTVMPKDRPFSPYRDPKHRELVKKGIRLAGRETS
jgi:adenylate cyclase